MGLSTKDSLIHAIIGTRKRSGKDFETLYLLTYRNIYDEIRSTVPDRETLATVLEETYVKIWESAESIPGPDEWDRWTHGIIAAVYQNVIERQSEGKDNGPAGGQSVSQDEGKPDERPDGDSERQIRKIPKAVPDGVFLQEREEMLLRIEERLGIFNVHDEEERTVHQDAYTNIELREKRKGLERRFRVKAILGSLAAAVLLIAAIAVVLKLRATVQNREHFTMRDINQVIATVEENREETAASAPEDFVRTGWVGEGFSRQYLDQAGNPVKNTWKLDGEDLYYLNRVGYMEIGNERGQFTASGKRYTLLGGALADVENDEIEIYDATFRISRGEVDNYIYCDNHKEFEDGIAITGICGIDKVLYYCVVDRIDGETPVSYLRSFDLDNWKQKTVSEEFSGFMRDMYYDAKRERIYMAYCPEDLDCNYETIAYYDLNSKSIYLLEEDSGVLAERKHNDVGLKLVGGDENTLYCLKYRYSEQLAEEKKAMKEKKEKKEDGEAEENLLPTKKREVVVVTMAKRKKLA